MMAMERQPDSIPDGYIFRPTDGMLLRFLALFVTGKPVLSTVPIAEINLYNGMEPWQVFQHSKERTLYFFTPLKRMSPGHSRYSRTIGDGKGTWKAQDRGKPIYIYDGKDAGNNNKHLNNNKQLIGYKRSLRYENRGSKYDGQFLMKEYFLSNKIRSTLKAPLKDIVLCRIKRKQDRDITVSEESIEARDIGDIIGDTMESRSYPEVTSFLETSPASH